MFRLGGNQCHSCRRSDHRIARAIHLCTKGVSPLPLAIAPVSAMPLARQQMQAVCIPLVLRNPLGALPSHAWASSKHQPKCRSAEQHQSPGCFPKRQRLAPAWQKAGRLLHLWLAPMAISRGRPCTVCRRFLPPVPGLRSSIQPWSRSRRGAAICKMIGALLSQQHWDVEASILLHRCHPKVQRPQQCRRKQHNTAEALPRLHRLQSFLWKRSSALVSH